MRWILGLLLALLCCNSSSCEGANPQAASGAQRQTVKVAVDPQGLTIEQRNVRDRLVADNKPGSIKHLYVVSPYSGDVLIYSTVRGKVTSGGKRLNPSTVAGGDGTANTYGYRMGDAGGLVTHEVLSDDGTYGSSGDYLFWWDAKGVYHQHYLTGGQIVHVSDQPLAVKSVIINMETAGAP